MNNLLLLDPESDPQPWRLTFHYSTHESSRWLHISRFDRLSERAYDVDDDDFTELPLTKSFNLNPRLFIYSNDDTRITIGNATSYQNRKRRDVFAIDGGLTTSIVFREQRIIPQRHNVPD